jgi:imidazolonepropionase
MNGDTIRWVGRQTNMPGEYRQLAGDMRIDAGGSVVVPGLIDCHTHLAFGGWREDEFELRCRGTSYLDIAASGGGIVRTVRDTRAASEDELTRRAAGFLDGMLRLGVTAVECKSGYGLNVDDELKLLRVYQRLAAVTPVRIASTLLAAHVVPPEYKDKRQAYLSLICETLIPQVADLELAEFCDVFVESGAFTTDEARAVLETGKAHGLRAKLHADQLSSCGGAKLAAELGAVSADHLEHAADVALAAMADAGVVAVALPIASLYLSQPPMDARRFIEAGVDVAVATDFNPGSAPSYDLHLAIVLACTMNHMTPAEALKAVTINAAKAIARADTIGSLEPGKKADFVLLDSSSVNHFAYHFRRDVVRQTYIGGECVYRRTGE